MQNQYYIGKVYNDTVEKTDQYLFQNHIGPHKISKVTIYTDKKVIYGLELEYTIYEQGKALVANGVRYLGSQAPHHIHSESLTLEADEFVTVVFGRHGDLIDCLGFKTTKGREVVAGGTGGNGFELKAENGHHFNTLAVGLGGHLHNFSFTLGELPSFQKQQTVSETLFAGITHNDTVEHSDEKLLASTNGHHKIHKIHIWHDKKVVYGLQVIYHAPGFGGQYIIIEGGKYVGNQLPHHFETAVLELQIGEFLVQAHGRCGDYMDAIGFRTSFGKEITVGGSGGKAWELAAKSGLHFSNLDVGIGGHLHFIKAHAFAQPQQQQQQQQQQFIISNQNQNQYSQQTVIVNQFSNLNIHENIQTTIFSAGKSHNDTQVFSDSGYLVSASGHQKIHKIHFLCDHEYIYGIQIEYSAPGFGGQHIQIEGGQHVGNQMKHGVKKETLVLESNEFVTEFHGYYTEVINSLGVKTTAGRNVTVGGNGTTHFELKAPQGYHFNSISGGLGGHLHNITVEAHKI